MPQHIGIVACSAEGAALCYRTICAEGAQLLGPHAHPEVSMHTHSLAEYVECLDRGDWQGVGELMLASADKLAKIGADFLICPDNTIHQALPLRRAALAAALAAHRRGRGGRGRRARLPAPRPDRHALARRQRGLSARSSRRAAWQCVRPSAAERDEINRIIMDELVYGVFKPEAVAYFQRVIGRMKERGLRRRRARLHRDPVDHRTTRIRRCRRSIPRACWRGRRCAGRCRRRAVQASRTSIAISATTRLAATWSPVFTCSAVDAGPTTAPRGRAPSSWPPA